MANISMVWQHAAHTTQTYYHLLPAKKKLKQNTYSLTNIWMHFMGKKVRRMGQ